MGTETTTNHYPRGMYKIHCFDIANKQARNTANNTFYDTYQEAVDTAVAYCQSNSLRQDYVIYQAVVRVRKTPPVPIPVEILPIIREDKDDPY